MKIIAHRGASAYAPENTHAAFKLAWRMGVDGIELDCHLSADGVPVVIHDPTLKRTGGIGQAVQECTAADLAQTDVGRWKGIEYTGECVPLLSEVLAMTPPKRSVFIELKSPAHHDLGRATAEVVSQYPELASYVHAISFEPALLHEWHAALPNGQSLLLLDEKSPLPGASAKYPWAGYGFSRRVKIPGTLLSSLRDNGATLSVWTVNRPSAIRKYQQLGFDYLTTDCPDVALRLRGGGSGPVD